LFCSFNWGSNKISRHAERFDLDLDLTHGFAVAGELGLRDRIACGNGDCDFALSVDERAGRGGELDNPLIDGVVRYCFHELAPFGLRRGGRG